MDKISIILPCAGSGTRLGLNYPKELYEVFDGFKLIDFSLNHILAYKRNNPNTKIKVIVTTVPSKISIFDYVKNRLSGINTIVMYYNKRFHEWAGSVYSASKHFENKSIVLLPDSIIKLSLNSVYYDKEGKTLIEKMSNALGKSDVVFAYKLCSDIEKLSCFGSLYVYGENIYLFQDKPKNNISNYNAFWTSYGFKKKIGNYLYCFLKESILHNSPQYEKQKFYPASAIKIEDYHDLGTWENINNFLKIENKNNYCY